MLRFWVLVFRCVCGVLFFDDFCSHFPLKRVTAFVALKLRKASGHGKDDQEEPKQSQAICLEHRNFEQRLSSCRGNLLFPQANPTVQGVCTIFPFLL